MKVAINVILAASLLPGTCVLAQEAGKSDRTLIQGTWLLVERVVDGSKTPPEELKNEQFRMIIEGDNFTNTKGGATRLVRGTQQLDSSRSPKSINRTFTEGESKGETFPGIYKLENGTLTLCFAQPDDKRPTAFESDPDSRRVLLVYKRETK